MGRRGTMEQRLEMTEGKVSETWPLPSTLDGVVLHGELAMFALFPCSQTPVRLPRSLDLPTLVLSMASITNGVKMLLLY
jgi:hypothetical protein